MLVGRAFAATLTVSLPSIMITPEEMSSNPAMVRRSVVLPQPEEPEKREELSRLDRAVDPAQGVIVAIVTIYGRP